MTINHIDQLAEWWETAEQGAPSKGDAIIRRTERLLSNGYAYEVGTEDYTDAKHLDNVRILSRAPKPKPAWHDAVAVMARFPNMAEGYRELMTRDEAHPDTWHSDHGYGYTEDLRDVTPLIEAKVTDEMVDRGCQAHLRRDHNDTFRETYRKSLHAALGLDAE